jgi:hypothetical protein
MYTEQECSRPGVLVRDLPSPTPQRDDGWHVYLYLVLQHNTVFATVRLRAEVVAEANQSMALNCVTDE